MLVETVLATRFLELGISGKRGGGGNNGAPGAAIVVSNAMRPAIARRIAGISQVST